MNNDSLEPFDIAVTVLKGAAALVALAPVAAIPVHVKSKKPEEVLQRGTEHLKDAIDVLEHHDTTLTPQDFKLMAEEAKE